MLEFVAQHPHALLRMHGISVVPNPHRANGLAARPRAAKADIKPLPGLSILSSCSTVLYTGTFTDKFDWQEVKDAAGEIVTVAGWEPQLESSVFTPAPICKHLPLFIKCKMNAFLIYIGTPIVHCAVLGATLVATCIATVPAACTIASH
jgi:hypothetical protein